MAKAWPKVRGRRPGQSGNRPPNPGRPRPFERDETYKQIGQVIVDAWKAAVRDTDRIPLDREHLQAEISRHLELVDDPKGRVEVGVILDPKPDANGKFIWIVIPYPDAPENISEKDWSTSMTTTTTSRPAWARRSSSAAAGDPTKIAFLRECHPGRTTGPIRDLHQAHRTS